MHVIGKENVTSVLFWYHDYWKVHVVINCQHIYIWCELPTIFQAVPSFYITYVFYGLYKIFTFLFLIVMFENFPQQYLIPVYEVKCSLL